MIYSLSKKPERFIFELVYAHTHARAGKCFVILNRSNFFIGYFNHEYLILTPRAWMAVMSAVIRRPT